MIYWHLFETGTDYNGTAHCSVGQALIYHLADVRGMSLSYDKFGVLGLNTETVQRAVSVGGAFMLKASELQQ